MKKPAITRWRLAILVGSASLALFAVAPASAATTFSVNVHADFAVEGSPTRLGVEIACFDFQTGGGLGYTATIDWGDGTATSPGGVTIFAPPPPSCEMSVFPTETHVYAAAGTYTKTVQVINTAGDFIGTGTGSVTVSAVPSDVGVSIGAAPNPVTTQTNVTYSITVANHSDTPASGVQVTNTFPAGVQFVSYGASQGTCVTPAVGQTGVMVCNLGRIAANGTATITAVAKVVVTSNSLIDTASVSTTDPDPISANNSATVETSLAGGKGGGKGGGKDKNK